MKSRFTALTLLAIIAIALTQTIFGAPVQMAADTIQGKKLGEVTVELQNIEHKGTHDVVIITPELRKNAKNISEVIGRLAGFTYNPMDKTLKYLGESKVKILVDSIDKNIDHIAQLSHQRFSKIDVIFNPAGRYQDYDVLVNLHTKINYEGYDLYAQEKGAVMPSGRNGDGKDFSFWDNKLMFNYVRNKFTAGAYASYVWNRNGTSTYHAKDYPLNDLHETDIEQKRTSPTNLNKISRANISVFGDYQINERNMVSLVATYTHQNNLQQSFREMTVSSPIHRLPYSETLSTTSDIKPIYNYNATLYYTGRSNNWAYGAAFQYSDVKQRIMRDARYSGGFQLPDNRIGRGNHELADIDLSYTANNRKWLFNFNYRIFNQDYRDYRIETGERLSNTEQLFNRGTLSASWYPTRRLSMRLSGGVQASHISSGNVTQTTIDPRADLYLSYAFTQKNWMRIIYSTSVSQPFIGQMADYGQFTDSLMYEQGNPYLKESPFHNVNIVFGLWNILNVRAKAGISPRSMSTIYQSGYGMRPDGTEGYYVLSTPENTSWKYWGFRVEFNKMFNNHWHLSGNVDIEKRYASYNDFRHNALGIQGSVMCRYSLGKHGLHAFLSYNISNGESATAQSITTDHSDRLSAMVTKSLLRDRLTIELAYYTPLHFTSGNFRSHTYSPALNIFSWSNNQFRQDNMLVLTLSYRINKGQQVRRINHKELSTD